jgi:hypothetical protein
MSHSNTLKIFYVSLQRSGTKSFGEFFRRNGYAVASWPETRRFGWTVEALIEGKLRWLVESESFNAYSVFEDGPWFDIAVTKYLYWHYPNSRFVYFGRPVEDWFKSMLAHSRGRIIGNPKRHCVIYNRLAEYYAAVEAGDSQPKLSMVGQFEHYRVQFENHALRIQAFFEDKPKHRFFRGDLYDKDKWKKLNEQMGLGLANLADVHIHKSATRENW